MAVPALLKRILALAAVHKETLLDYDHVEAANGMSDQDRIDRIARGCKDTLFELGKVVSELSDVATEAWRLQDVYHRRWTPSLQEKMLRGLGTLERLCWVVHGRVRGILPTDTKDMEFKAQIVATSWVATMSTFLLPLSFRANLEDADTEFHRMPMSVVTPVLQYGFTNSLLSAGRESIVHSTEVVANMSVTTWRYTVDDLWSAMCRYGWTPSAAALLDALAARYALWLVYHPGEDDSEEVFDHRMYCCRRGDHTLPLHPRLTLTFVYHMEKLLYHALRHSRAASAFVDHPQSRPLIQTAAWRLKMVQALEAFMRDFIKDAFLVSETRETVGGLLVRRQLVPGEADRVFYENGSTLVGVAIDGDGVLYDSRRAEWGRLDKDVIPLAWTEPLKQWAATPQTLDFTGESSQWDTIAAQRSVLERTALLILESALDQYMSRQGVSDLACSFRRYGYMDDAGLTPPKDAPPESPEAACRGANAAVTLNGGQGGSPLFVAVAHMYAVVVPQPEKAREVQEVWVTPYLPDALACWLTYAVGRARVRKEQLPRTLWECVGLE